MKPAASGLDLSEDMRAVLDRLRRDSDRVFGTRRAEIVPLTFAVRESAEVTRARIVTSMGVRYVFAKVFRPRPGEIGLSATRTRFRKDYDVTMRVCAAMRAMPELRSVEPIACYDDLLGVVTNEIQGVPLSAFLTRNAAWPYAGSRVVSLEADLSRVGRWISTFQRVAPAAPTSAVSLDATREYIDVRLRKLISIPRAAVSETDRQEVLTYFDRRAAEVSSTDLVDVAVHGDIVPSNIVIAPDCVTVLDFGMTDRGSKYLDIARLYTQLEFYTAKPQYRPQVIARLQRAALGGFDPSLRSDNPLFEICAVQHVVCHLLSQARQPGSFPVSVYSAHQCRRHRRWLRERGRTPRTHSVAATVRFDGVQ